MEHFHPEPSGRLAHQGIPISLEYQFPYPQQTQEFHLICKKILQFLLHPDGMKFIYIYYTQRRWEGRERESKRVRRERERVRRERAKGEGKKRAKGEGKERERE